MVSQVANPEGDCHTVETVVVEMQVGGIIAFQRHRRDRVGYVDFTLGVAQHLFGQVSPQPLR